jgi:cob(I)alamin adenosyltransferase
MDGAMVMTEHKAKIYTKSGDDGHTSRLDGSRVPKSDPHVAAGGVLDELSAQLGLVRALAAEQANGVAWREELVHLLERVQNQLFDLGELLSGASKGGAKFDEEYTAALEDYIDRLDEQLPPLKQFLLPGGTLTAAALHVARTVCRRAESQWAQLLESNVAASAGLRYLNRLSDLLFVLARWTNLKAGVVERERRILH